jgi:hypothetical protein
MILLKPDWRYRTGAIAVLVLAALLCLHVTWRWQALGWSGRTLLPAGAAILAAWAVDLLQRRYELRARQICVRYFFVVWSVYTLPPELRMRTDPRGRLLVSGRTGRAVVVPRAYNRQGELEKRYWHLWAFRDEIAAASAPPRKAPARSRSTPVAPIAVSLPRPTTTRTWVDAR